MPVPILHVLYKPLRVQDKFLWKLLASPGVFFPVDSPGTNDGNEANSPLHQLEERKDFFSSQIE